MKSVIIFAALIGLSYQGTTTHAPHQSHATHPNAPHTTHEPSVNQQYVFHYDHVTHKMIVHKDSNCYIFTLTDQERMDVHTDSGLTALEVKFLQMIGTGTKTGVTRASLEHSITVACGARVLHFYTVA